MRNRKSAGTTWWIKFKNPSSVPSYIKALWRYQSIEGFDDVNAIVKFGKVSRGFSKNINSEEIKKLRKPVDLQEDDLQWLHVVFADTRNGGCVDKKIRINTGLKAKKRWSLRTKFLGNRKYYESYSI